MKKIVVLAFAAMLSIGSMVAKNIVTKQFVAEITCAECEKKINDNIPALGNGIEDVKIDRQSGIVTVKFDADRNSDEKIIAGLKSLGVAASAKGEVAQQTEKVEKAHMGSCSDAHPATLKADGKKDCCKTQAATAEKKSCCKAGDKKTETKKDCCKTKAAAEKKSCCKAGEKKTEAKKDCCKTKATAEKKSCCKTGDKTKGKAQH